jgi:hypothetical protein
MEKRNKYCTIYILKNIINSKVYIGQTWKNTSRRMQIGYAGSYHINNAIIAYGKDKFYYEELMRVHDQIDADFFEILFIEQYNSTNREIGYNIEHGGNGREKVSEETLVKMRNRKHSPETLKKMSDSHLGQSPANKGKPSPFKGIKRNKEIGQKISKSKTKYQYLAEKMLCDYNLGLNTWEIADKYGVSQTTSRRILKSVNVKFRKKGISI